MGFIGLCSSSVCKSDEKRCTAIISKIENLVYGCVQKGNINTKILNFSPVYDKLNDSQYKALMVKMGEA